MIRIELATQLVLGQARCSGSCGRYALFDAPRRYLLAMIAAMAAAIALAVDFVAPPVAVDPGSVGLPIEISGLTELDPGTDCDGSIGKDPCPRAFAYAPGGSLTVWVSIRNDGPFDLTLQSVGREAIERSREIVMLSNPVQAFDRGDMLAAPANGPRHDPFVPITLAAGHERVVGLEFRTTDDIDFACEHWQEDGGIGWDQLTIEWSWLVFRHEQDVPFGTQLTFMAPLAADCAG